MKKPPTLTCAFGAPWGIYGCGTKEGESCPKCQAYSDQLQREFDRDVFFGLCDRDGYTPSDRAAQVKRKGKAA